MSGAGGREVAGWSVAAGTDDGVRRRRKCVDV